MKYIKTYGEFINEGIKFIDLNKTYNRKNLSIITDALFDETSKVLSKLGFEHITSNSASKWNVDLPASSHSGIDSGYIFGGKINDKKCTVEIIIIHRGNSIMYWVRPTNAKNEKILSIFDDTSVSVDKANSFTYNEIIQQILPNIKKLVTKVIKAAEKKLK